MPKEYIARDAAIIGLAASSLLPHQIDDAAEALKLVPTADVVEVRHGCWIIASKLHPLPWDTDPLDWDRYDEKTHSEWEDYYECSECHKGEYDIKPRCHYCPNCGAKMDGGINE